MKPEFSEEERTVLDEFVFNVKKDKNAKLVVVQVGDIENQMKYNFHHGKGASYILLKKALPYLHEMYDLDDEEFRLLEKKAEKVAKYEVWHWEYSQVLPEIDDNLIVIRGANYVILKSGMRIDYGTDYYQHLREEFQRTGVYDEGMR